MMKKKIALFLLVFGFVACKLDAIVKISQNGMVFVSACDVPSKGTEITTSRKEDNNFKKVSIYKFDDYVGIKAIAVSGDGSIIVLGDDHGIVYVLHLNDENWSEKVLEYKFDPQPNISFSIKSVAITRDGSTIVVGNENGKVAVFNLNLEQKKLGECIVYNKPEYVKHGYAIKSIYIYEYQSSLAVVFDNYAGNVVMDFIETL
jgi:WD40 repeat protein